MAKIARFFNNVSVTTSGYEITNILGAIKNIDSGTIDQIVISEIAGSATELEIQIRYESGYSGREKLVYLYTDAALPLFVDSHIDGQFSLYNVNLEGDIHLYLVPDSNCVLNIRIDIDINNSSARL